MHPVKFLMEEIYHDYWGIPARKREAPVAGEVPVRPRKHPLQRLFRLP